MTPPGNLHGVGRNRHGKRFSPSSPEDEEGGGRQPRWVLCGAALGRGKGITTLGHVGCRVGRSCRGSAHGVGRAGWVGAADPAKGGWRQMCP